MLYVHVSVEKLMRLYENYGFVHRCDGDSKSVVIGIEDHD